VIARIPFQGEGYKIRKETTKHEKTFRKGLSIGR
jgi:hypothetical protein